MRRLLQRLLVMALLIDAAFGGAVDGRAKVLDSSNDLDKRSLD